MLVLACSRIHLLQGRVYCLLCSGCTLGFLPTYLVFSSSKENSSHWESNRQPLHLEMGTSPLSPGSLGSSRTIDGCKHYPITKKMCLGHANTCLLSNANVHRFEDGESAIVRVMALGLVLLATRNQDMS